MKKTLLSILAIAVLLTCQTAVFTPPAKAQQLTTDQLVDRINTLNTQTRQLQLDIIALRAPYMDAVNIGDKVKAKAILRQIIVLSSAIGLVYAQLEGALTEYILSPP